MRPIVVLLGFPYFISILAVLGSWNPSSPFVHFDPQTGPFYIPKTLRLKGKFPVFTQKCTQCKTGEKRQEEK